MTYQSILKSNPIFPSTVVYDRERCGLSFFDEGLGSMRDDFVYLLAILKKIDYAYGNRNVLVDYRLRKSSVTGNKKKVIIPQWNVLRKIEKLPLPLCWYYITCWAILSYLKYRK
ncbi:hypothetical protein EVD33_10045 [Bacteroidales bacterium SW292]|nr:hypothetical protein [Bacteroidales bacterium SW292]